MHRGRISGWHGHTRFLFQITGKNIAFTKGVVDFGIVPKFRLRITFSLHELTTDDKWLGTGDETLHSIEVLHVELVPVTAVTL
jgi:hypothetical protein